MKLKDRLSLYSILIFSVVIFLASATIYLSFYQWMHHNKITVLQDKTLLAAIYYLEADEVSLREQQTTTTRLRQSISRTNIGVFNELNRQTKGEMLTDELITPIFLQKVRQQKQHHFTSDTYFYNGLFYEDNEGDFVVVTREIKTDFNKQLLILRTILSVVFIIGVALIFVLSQFLGKIAYKPIINIIEQLKDRDDQNFTKPIHTAHSYSEISDLVQSYNQFISRLDQTFQIQKNFIDYVSHELRTPITALLGSLEVTNKKTRTAEEYQQLMKQLNQYVTDLNTTLDQMMLLSGAKTKFEFEKLHMDEIIWQITETMMLYHRVDIQVELKVKNPELLQVNGNLPLLQAAFNNIIENAVKYSNKQLIKIVMKEKNHQLMIQVIDTGIGILDQDLQHVRNNFFRGSNAKSFSGKGIGLSLANIVFYIHKIELDIFQNQPKGTIVQLTFPKF